MENTILAAANPEKRLFISLLTRDIPLVAAFLDLVDNSINAALEPFANRLKSASDYLSVDQDDTVHPRVTINLVLASNKIEIRDTASGISAKTASEHVFKFGRSVAESHGSDRLSVYGIGLKRAIFKLGNRIAICSDHASGGFDLDLDVAKWAEDQRQPWVFDISQRPAATPEKCGTRILIEDLNDDVKRRLTDSTFEGQLRDALARTYAFYLSKFVTITVNEKPVAAIDMTIGRNYTSDFFELGTVTCAITAGIGTPVAGAFRDSSSGWFVFCNGRAVVSADKSPLTGWGSPGCLPIFQPKHRPFIGTVFFVSPDPEQLPWTTTKSGINEDSVLWQQAKRHMAATGRIVEKFLSGRYTDEGTEVASQDLQDAAGGEPISVLSAAVSKKSKFSPPAAQKLDEVTRIQYDAKVIEIKRIALYLKRPSISKSEVGRHTFQFFLRNEVGE